MGKAHSRLFYHFVWTTKNRAPAIGDRSKAALFASIQRKCRGFGVEIRALNAVADHVHLLAQLPPTIPPSQFVRQVKGAASFAVNHVDGNESLYWQRGYGVLSLSSADLKRVTSYIEKQQEHHRCGDVWPSLERAEERGDA